MKHPELLAPAGNFETLQTALNAGADAVYFGIAGMNMREGAKNFFVSDLPDIVRRCHQQHARAYLTVNTIIYDNELEKMKELIICAKKTGVDAIICWDHAVIKACLDNNMEVHLSTQASVSNFESLSLYARLGVKRFVLARELSLPMIREICKKVTDAQLDIEIECFVHGAMCISESGRCFLSTFCSGKSANRGECMQSCRRSYVIRDKEDGHEFTVEHDRILSPKDMCTIKIIDKLIEAGINVFKIEGRMRAPEYVDVVVRTYKKAIEAHFNGKLSTILKDELENDLFKVYHRGFSSGFYMGVPLNEWSSSHGSLATQKRVLLGSVSHYYTKISVFEFKIEAKEDISLGDELTIVGPTTGLVRCHISSMRDDKGGCRTASQGTIVAIKSDSLVREGDKVYVLREQKII